LPAETAPEDVAAADGTAIGGAPIDEATKLAAEPKERVRKPADAAAGASGGKKDKVAEVRLHSLDELVEFFIAAGKKGVAINRYKGLGEMNPRSSGRRRWIRPCERSCRSARGSHRADLMFTTLMGDQVEPRRKFIEDNALDVKNLDV